MSRTASLPRLPLLSPTAITLPAGNGESEGMALESVGRIDGFDKDGKARRIIVYRRNGATLFALASRRHLIETADVDYVAEASQAFGMRDCRFHQD
jgi:hypothetical protein